MGKNKIIAVLNIQNEQTTKPTRKHKLKEKI